MSQSEPHAQRDYHAQDLQRDIAQALLHPDAPMPAKLTDAVNHGKISTQARLDIYKNNVIGGLIEIILARYPSISPLVGDEFARAMARTYVSGHPPKTANMNEYGADYPAFIQSFPPAQELAFLPDVARLEGLEHHAYYAPDAQALTSDNAAQYLPQILAGAVGVNLHPSCRFMRSAYPVLDLQNFAQSGGAETADFDLDAGAQQLMVWRCGLRVESLAIDEARYAFFGILQAKQDIHSALERALGVDDKFNFEALLQDMLPRDIFIIV